MNEFLEVIGQYKYATTAISKRFKEQMDRNECIEIKPVQNGYVVEYSYRQITIDGKTDMDYRYMSEKYIYTSWDDVVKYVADKKLDIPANK